MAPNGTELPQEVPDIDDVDTHAAADIDAEDSAGLVEDTADSFRQEAALALTGHEQPETNTDVRRPKNFKAVLERWRNQPKGEQTKDGWLENGERRNAVIQFKNIVSGEDHEGIHRTYYSDWSIDDFKALLDELGEANAEGSSEEDM